MVHNELYWKMFCCLLMVYGICLNHLCLIFGMHLCLNHILKLCGVWISIAPSDIGTGQSRLLSLGCLAIQAERFGQQLITWCGCFKTKFELFFCCKSRMLWYGSLWSLFWSSELRNYDLMIITLFVVFGFWVYGLRD